MEWERVLPIVVQFGLGAVLCALGIWAGLRGGYLDFRLRADRRLVGVFVAGYLGLLLLSCVFTFWLPYVGGEGRP